MMSRLSIAALALVLVFSACKKKSSDPEPDPAPTTTGAAPAPIDINHNPIVQYEADSKSYQYQNGSGVAGGMGSSASLATSSGGTSTASYDAYYYNNNGNYTYFSVEKGTLYTPGIGRPDEAAFRQFFAVGQYNYSSTSSPALLNGIVIEHRDDNGVTWVSNKGTADQTGSSFNIVSNKEETNFGDQQMKIYATFNCKVYDDNGNSKILTNGKFVGYFENM
jgi:hypothetical protein